MENYGKAKPAVKSDDDRITFGQLAAYSAGGIIPVALFNIAGQLVGLMGNISLGLSAFWLGLIMIIPRLWDAFSDPVVGHLSDNTRTRWGRRRPYLLIGGVAVAIFFVVLWWIPRGEFVHELFQSDESFKWFQLIYILFALMLFFTATTVFEIPHGALGMEMTTDPHERTRLFSGKSFIGNLFAMSTPWLFALANTEMFRGAGGNEADGMRYVSLLIAAVLIPLSFWWSAKLKEPGFTAVKKQEKTHFWNDIRIVGSNRNFIFLVLTIFTLAMGFNFVNLLGSYIPIFYVFGGDKIAGARLLGINGTVWAITGVLAVFPLNWISPKLGKRNTLIISILLMCLAQLSKIVCYNPDKPYLVLIPTVLLSAGMLFFFTLGSSMVGDVCDEDELKTGHRSQGSYYSVYWWFIKLGTAVASFVAGILITLTMFDETQVTRVDNLQGSIREMEAAIQIMENNASSMNKGSDYINESRVLISGALKTAGNDRQFIVNEMNKKPGRNRQGVEDEAIRRKLLLNSIATTDNVVMIMEHAADELNDLRDGSDFLSADTIMRKAIPVILDGRMARLKIYSYDLMSQFHGRHFKDMKSIEHQEYLIQYMNDINNRIEMIDTHSKLEGLLSLFNDIEFSLTPLKKQSPFTLLMMRIVEIGLPVLLSLLALFFAFRYSLTDKRTFEVKELLRHRNINC